MRIDSRYTIRLFLCKLYKERTKWVIGLNIINLKTDSFPVVRIRNDFQCHKSS
jgi:hypothetical protein